MQNNNVITKKQQIKKENVKTNTNDVIFLDALYRVTVNNKDFRDHSIRYPSYTSSNLTNSSVSVFLRTRGLTALIGCCEALDGERVTAHVSSEDSVCS